MTTAVPDQQRQPPPMAEADAEQAERLAYVRARCEEVRKRALAALKAAANCKTGSAAVRPADRAAVPGSILDGWRRLISVRS
jgi:hypothetical protein